MAEPQCKYLDILLENHGEWGLEEVSICNGDTSELGDSLCGPNCPQNRVEEAIENG